MYQVTKASIEILPIADLYKAKEAIRVLQDLDIHQVDIDVRRFIDELISKKEQSRI